MPKGQVPVNKRYDEPRLVAMLEEGIARNVIAKEFGVARDTVDKWVRALKRPEFHMKGGWARRFEDSQVERLLDQGASLKRISRVLNVDPRSISRAKERLGRNTGFRPERISEERRAHAVALLEDGASYRDVWRTTGISERWLQRNLPGMGWTKEEIDAYSGALRSARAAGVDI